MSRELKFRAWDKGARRMVHVTDITIDLRNDVVYLLWVKDTPDGNGRTVCFDEFELMQFIGIHDVNGREIYEGDIVTIWDYDLEGNMYERRGVVEFNKGAYCVNLGTALHYFCLGLDEVEGYEVIGSIHENPELLEVAEDA